MSSFFLFLFLQDDHYLGPSVDIWALGILLYLMVTGGMPFKGTTVAELKNAILDGHFEMPDYLSQSCIDLIVGILKRRPDWRLTLQQVRNSFPFFVLSLFTKYVYKCSRHLELKRIPYARHYKPRLVYFLPHLSVWFIINITDYSRTKQGRLGLKSRVFNQERVMIAHVW